MNPLLRQLKTSVSTYHASALNETVIWIPPREDTFYNSIKVDHMQMYASHREPGGSWSLLRQLRRTGFVVGIFAKRQKEKAK